LTLAPQTDQYGTATITVRATDGGGLYVENTFDIVINSPPTLDAISNQSFEEGESVAALSASATDPEDDGIVYSIESGAPAGVGINSSSGAFTVDPDAGSASGSPYTVVVRATDDSGFDHYDETSFTMTVTEPSEEEEVTTQPGGGFQKRRRRRRRRRPNDIRRVWIPFGD
jgi:hypothetical protein